MKKVDQRTIGQKKIGFKNLSKLSKKIKKIELAPTKNIDKYQKEIDIVLKYFGHPEALVTDLSSAYDFLDIFDKKYHGRRLEMVSKKMGFEVKEDDLIFDIAKKMRKATKKEGV